MPPSRWTAIRWGSASSSSSTCGRCMGTRRRPILPSKASSIRARRSTEARRSRSGRNIRGPASARSRRRAWRSASRSPRSCVGRNRPATGSCAHTSIRRRGDVGLLKDWNYVEQAVRIPALAELIREALIRALFVRDDRVLPASIIGDLNRLPPVTVKVKEDGEVRKLIRVLNGEESTVSLGLNAEDYHFFRTQLGVGRTREFGLTMRPRVLLTYDWIVPEQRGVQLDFTAYAGVEFAEDGHRAIAQVGALWKRLYDDALAAGHLVPFVPTVPLDFAVGDAVYGDAPFGSFRGGFASYVNALRTISPYGHRARIGFEEVANNGTAYDLLHASIPLAGEFFVPVAIALRLEAEPVARSLFVGEVRVPAKSFGDFAGKMRAFGDQSSAKAGIYGSLGSTGIVSAFPSFSAPKDRIKVYDLSKGVRAIVARIPGAAFTGRLTHLWEEEPNFLRRMALWREMKLQIDAAHVVQPLVAP